MSDQIAENTRLYKFEYIRDMMISNITCGNLKINTKLPSIQDICQSYKVSPVTVRRAYMHLRKRGYITHAPGLGYFVETRDGTSAKQSDTFNSALTNNSTNIYLS